MTKAEADKLPVFMVIKQQRSKPREKKKWTQAEDNVLREFLKMKKKHKWTDAVKFLKNKTPMDCYYRCKKLNPSYNKGKWTDDEDKKLLQLHKLFGNDWRLISLGMRERSNKQIFNRFKILCLKNKENLGNLQMNRIHFYAENINCV